MMRHILLLLSAVYLISCQDAKRIIPEVSFMSFIKNDTVFLKIKNNSGKSIFIPEKYIGTYNLGNDTIYLLSLDRPEYNTDKYYLYSKVLPFKFYTKNPIPEIASDSILVDKRQTYYFNQFIPPSFRRLDSNSDTMLQVSFTIPEQARIITAAYYETPFPVNYQMTDDTLDIFARFVKFERENARYVSTNAIMIVR